MLQGNNGSYKKGNRVANAGKYQLFLSEQEQTQRQCLLAIAKEIEHNVSLDRAGFILKILEQTATEIDEKSVAEKNTNAPFNYGIQFPEVIDNFDHEGRRTNVMAFREIPKINKLVPLSNITTKDRQRIDLRSSAWIMGKLLKLLSFTHGSKISINYLLGSNILLEIDNHYVIVFDWLQAKIYQKDVPIEERRHDIAQAARSVIVALGGDASNGYLPNDGDEAFTKYSEYLLRLSRGSESRADRAHQTFYKIVDEFWKREFYPFTIQPL